MSVNALGDGALEFDAVLDASQFRKQLQKIENDLGGLANNARKEVSGLETMFKRAGAAAAGFFTIQAGQQFIRQLIQVRGEFQSLDISLQTLLQNKEKSDALFADVVTLAAKTPFQLTEVGQATKQLLAYGFASEDVIDVTRRLGDVSAGMSIPLNDLIYLYGTTRVQQRLYTRDLIQFTGRGINLMGSLAEQFGVAEGEVRKLVEAGEVGFENVKVAIEGMTNEGGSFFNLMEKQSGTLTGQISNLQDAFEVLLNRIGQSNEGILFGGIAGLRALIDNYDNIIGVLKVLVVTYGTYRAALIANAIATSTLGAAKIKYLRLLVNLRRAQVLLNTAISANPYVAIATAIAGLVTTLAVFSKRTDSASRAQERFNEAADRAQSNFEKEKEKIDNLVTLAGDQTQLYTDRQKAIKELNKISPEYLGNLDLDKIRTEEGTKAIEEYIRALRLKTTLSEIEAEKEKVSARIRKLQDTPTTSVPLAPGAVVSSSDPDPLTEKGRQKALQEQFKLLGLLSAREKELFQEQKAADDAADEAERHTVEFLKNKIATLEKERDQQSETSEQYIKNTKEIIKFEKELEAIIGGKQKKQRDLAKDYEEVRDALEGILNDIRINQLEANEQEIEEAKKKYDKLRDLAEGNKHLLAQIEKVQSLEIEAITDNQFKARLKKDSELAEAKAKKQEAEYKDLYDKTKTFEQQYTDLLVKYDKDRRLLVERGDFANLKVRDRQFEEERDELAKNALQANESAQKLFGDLEGYSKEAITRMIREVNRLIDELLLQGLLSEDSPLLKSLRAQLTKLTSDLDGDISENFRQIGHALGEMSFNAREFNRTLGDILATSADVLINIAGIKDSFDQISKAQKDGDLFGQALGGLGAASGIIGAFSAIKKLFDNVADNIFKQIESMGRFYQSIIEQQNRYNLALNEQIRLQESAFDSVFVTDYANKIAQGYLSIADANQSVRDISLQATGEVKNMFDLLDSLQVQTGAKLKTFLFIPTGIEKEFSGLLETYPDLIDANGKFNVELAKTILNMGNLPKNTRLALEALIEYQEQIEEAQQQIEDAVEALVGSFGNELRDALVTAFEEGKTAAEAFVDAAGTVEDAIEGIVEQVAFAAIIGPYLKQLQEDIQESFSPEGDQSVTDDFANFLDGLEVGLPRLFDVLEEWKKKAEERGFDLFSPDEPNQRGLSGSIRRDLTEQTAGELAGLWRGQFDITKQTLAVSQQQLSVAINIERNTGLTVEEIKGMRSDVRQDLQDINSSISRSSGRDRGIGG